MTASRANMPAPDSPPLGARSRFYPLVDSAETLQQLLPSGIGLVQLRSKLPAGPSLSHQIERARDLCRAANCQLVINDHWREAIETGCEHIHLGQEDLDGADLAAIRSAGIQIGISTHNQHELDRALQCNADAIALGPIFPTTSKTLAWEAQGLDKLALWKRKIGARPLIAIGGITLERAPLVLAAGADAIAVIGDVATHTDPLARCQQWLATTLNR
ncbi:MAG: thiamine phosphate synthase [Burkholderiaceae bacterium]